MKRNALAGVILRKFKKFIEIDKYPTTKKLYTEQSPKMLVYNAHQASFPIQLRNFPENLSDVSWFHLT